MAEYSLFLTAFIFHCHNIYWLSSLVPGLFPVVSLSSDVTSQGDKAGTVEVSTRTCKVLFSWFSILYNGFLTLFYFILFYFIIIFFFVGGGAGGGRDLDLDQSRCSQLNQD